MLRGPFSMELNQSAILNTFGAAQDLKLPLPDLKWKIFCTLTFCVEPVFLVFVQFSAHQANALWAILNEDKWSADQNNLVVTQCIA